MFRRSLFAFLPNTKSIASITFDFPEPFGPTTDEKHLWKGPIFWTPAYDLKLRRTIFSIIRRAPDCWLTPGVFGFTSVGAGGAGGAAEAVVSAMSVAVDEWRKKASCIINCWLGFE